MQGFARDGVVLRLADWGFGLSAVGWAVRTALSHGASIVGATLAILNLTAGLLLLMRRAPERHAPLRDSFLCLASLFASGVVLKLAPRPESWPLGAALLFAVTGVGAVASLATLGASFGVLPAWRGLVVRGPYRLLRHPAYACELLLVLACGLAAPRDPALWLSCAGAAALLVLRIHIEERLLAQDPEYAAYRARVPWRLLPGAW
jgi:protein-S-isoprenylcysteine O-methyltransferase Ste14